MPEPGGGATMQSEKWVFYQVKDMVQGRSLG